MTHVKAMASADEVEGSTMTLDEIYRCRCECGRVQYSTNASPLFRMICHCTICQRFNDAPFADIAVFRARDVEVPSANSVNFATWRPPPNVQRGTCADCGQAAIELFDIPLAPALVMVPVSVIQSPEKLEQPKAHMFFQTRLIEPEDTLPRYRGYISSQLAFFRYYVGSVLDK